MPECDTAFQWRRSVSHRKEAYGVQAAWRSGIRTPWLTNAKSTLRLLCRSRQHVEGGVWAFGVGSVCWL